MMRCSVRRGSAKIIDHERGITKGRYHLLSWCYRNYTRYHMQIMYEIRRSTRRKKNGIKTHRCKTLRKL